ncbi:MAG: 50S ribosomal protein L3 [Actinomycetota bacterium]|nr:50S ribosomal protein L3 [Actinomycetota bacterium]
MAKKAILGKKLGMTQLFVGDVVVPVTVIKAGPCHVTQLKSNEKDGYEAVQLGYGDVKEARVNQPMKGHFRKAGTMPLEILAEVPLNPQEFKVGQKILADIFHEGERADVTGVSKGKGFSGVVKRWGFSGGPASHGSTFHRAPGSIGQCATPSRVFKGRKLPGRAGGARVTAQNLEIFRVDSERNLILVRGAVPGPKGSLVVLRESVKSGRGKAGKRVS